MRTQLQIIVLVISLISCFPVIAQINLVPNGGFEDTVSCPAGLTEINRALGWSSYRGTPDYFNSCGDSSVGVPSNWTGYQQARSGQAYAGFATFSILIPAGREYLGIELTDTLNVGSSYIISFYVSRACSTWTYTGISSNKIGARFSTVPFSFAHQAPLDNISHLHTDSVITDSTNWVLISGRITADSSYKFLIIGNFYDDLQTSSATITADTKHAYYFIDDVSVVLDSSSINNIDETSNSPGVFTNREFIIISGNDLSLVSLFDITGRQLYVNNNSTEKEVKIKTSGLKSGLYIAVVRNEGHLSSFKISVIH
jgi:hypothetical protein